MPSATRGILADYESDLRKSERGIVIRKTFALSLCLIILAGLTSVAYDRSEFLFLDEIDIGMTGIGKTIVAADTITEFAVEVVGIIDQPGDLSDFITVRVSGEAIGRAGGIAQGMSGSPIYIDGKLIGALSRAATWSKDLTPIGLVTPIEPMLAVFDAADAAHASAQPNEGAILDGIRLVEVAAAPSPETVVAAPDAIFAYPVSTPILTNGLSDRALSVLMGGLASSDLPLRLIDNLLPASVRPEARGLSSLGLSLLPASGSGEASSIDPASLEPGSAIGVALATGDISVGALGTLTYRDGDTLVGFGHRFINNGSSAFPMATVSIIDTMKAYDASFKLGTLGTTIGTVFEDRAAAIGGRIGDLSVGIELATDVVDSDSGRTETFSVDLVDEPRLMPELLLSTGLEAIDTTLDRIGQGTVVVTYEIDGTGMPSTLERRDTFMSALDIAVYPPLQLAAIVGALQYNAFADPEITRIETSMEFTDEIKGIWINDLEIDRLTYAPGEPIQFRLTLQTFQGTKFEREGEIIIPEELYADYILVRAYGGPRYLESGETAEVFEDLGDLVEAIERFPSYETLTVELFAVDPFAAMSDALYGVDEVTFDFPGFVVYGEREVSALLFAPYEEAIEEAEPDW